MHPDLGRATPDLIALGALVFAFAALVTVHVALAYRLGRDGPLWRGWAALAVPPLAPVWGFLAGLRFLPALWLVSAVAYLVSLAFVSL
jgi:hypothetical protein